MDSDLPSLVGSIFLSRSGCSNQPARDHIWGSQILVSNARFRSRFFPENLLAMVALWFPKFPHERLHETVKKHPRCLVSISCNILRREIDLNLEIVLLIGWFPCEQVCLNSC